MGKVQDFHELIRLPYINYLQYLILLDLFDKNTITNDLLLIGISPYDLDDYIAYYKQFFFEKVNYEVNYLSGPIKSGALAKYKKKPKKHIAAILKEAKLDELYSKENYYLRYILLHPKLREMINELGLKKINPGIVLSILRDWGNIIIPQDQLELYYKYFWNFRDMTIDDWYNYLETIDDIELRDRYVDILSNDASYILGEYDYSESIDPESVVNYTFKKVYMRFRRLVELGQNDEAILRYADMIRKYAADMHETNSRDNSDVKALMALLADAQVGYKEVEDVFNEQEGEGIKEQKGKSDLEDGLLDLSKVNLPDG